jgi:hypothetical protein
MLSKYVGVMFQGKLHGYGSRVKALLAHPGICESAFRPRPAEQGGRGTCFVARVLMSVMKSFSQSCGDGSMPMLAAAVHADAESGDFYGPSAYGFFGKVCLPARCPLRQVFFIVFFYLLE